MENILQLLNLHFQRTNLPLSKPVVIHSCAGAGKTTLIQTILQNHPSATAYTHSTHYASSRDLAGYNLRPFSQYTPGHLDIIDEYLAGSIPPTACFLFADPYQYPPTNIRAHYTSLITHRFGPTLAAYLTTLGYHITSSLPAQPTELEFLNLWDWTPSGTCITHDEHLRNLLVSHSIPTLRPCEAIGLEFPAVDYVTPSTPSRATVTHLDYIALTRHTLKLRVITDDTN
nr:triple geneblock protein 1 [Nerine potexvirus 1]